MWDIKRPKETICPICGNDSLELYDEANLPQKYKALLRLHRSHKEDIGKLFNYGYTLSKFKCSKCHKTFGINWVLGYPIPYY